VQTHSFDRDWATPGFDDEDLRRLQQTIMDSPNSHPVIQGTGGLRKLRVAKGNRGKSGGVRVCFVYFPEFATVYLVVVFGKNERADLNAAERRAVGALIDEFRDECRKQMKRKEWN
jgi:hypothetical protein